MSIMITKAIRIGIILSCAFSLQLFLPPGWSFAEGPTEKDLKQANNPLAEFRALNFHNYYIPEVSGTSGNANAFWIRYAQPFNIFGSKWLMRASAPIQRVPLPSGETESGLGDSNVFAAYLFNTRDPSISVGLGPILGIPTATGGVPGGEKWSAGLAGVLFDARSSLFQWGGLVTWQTDIAGSGDEDINLLAVQPFGLLQIGGGFYLRSTGIWAFNYETDAYSVPIGFGIGKVLRSGKKVFNFFIEPQATILSKGPGQPEFQIFAGFNIQFSK